MIPKIVYLFGAGATHAELSNIVTEKESQPGFLEKKGLLMSQVSKRVTKIAKKDLKLTKNILTFFPKDGSSNIELLISLIEDNSLQNPSNLTIATKLKKFVITDIRDILTDRLRNKFYLYKSLLELDEQNKRKEKILGYISLNYDTILDEAYCEIKNIKYPNYCIPPFKFETELQPLLKLHGSFEWKTEKNNDIVKIHPIMPLGINKNYLQIPYNFIWGYAHEILRKCSILRIIGCSLSPNDYRLIDLIFKAQSVKKGSFEIHVIDFDENGDSIKDNYKFFQNIKNFSEIFGVKDSNSREQIFNESFQKWLKIKAQELKEENLKKTTYLKKLLAIE